MKVFFLVFLEGGFYDFVAYFLGFFVFDYGCVHVWFLEGVDFLESRWFFGGAADYCWRLWLFQCLQCFYVLLFSRLWPSLCGLGFSLAFQKL